MDMLWAYQEVSTYRGAAPMFGTTPRTARRAVERHNAGGAASSGGRGGATTPRWPSWFAERVAATSGRISASGCCPRRAPPGYAGSARDFRRLVASAKAV